MSKKSLYEKIVNAINYWLVKRKLAITQLNESDFEKIAHNLGCTVQNVRDTYADMMMEEVACIDCKHFNEDVMSCNLMPKCSGQIILEGVERMYAPFFKG